MEFYQVHRNTLMLQAASGVCQNADIMTRIRKLVRVNLLRLIMTVQSFFWMQLRII